ncbi:ABC transporter substrate-binding protein [Paenibacillus sp. FSL H8-0034]|uniref:ABC transporter substrate-binding protein n=1 Tax=Paenibacillus sp. FSL H8-0034 TaxID=2954671 RepID=UPI0030F74C2B
MITKKNRLLFMLAGTMLLASACSGPGAAGPSPDGSKDAAASKGPVKVTMWLTPIVPEETLKERIAAYNASQTEVQVDLTVLDFAAGREKIKVAISGGAGPDLFYIGNGLDQAYIDAKVLLPLEDAGFTKEELGRFNPLIGMNADQGKILAAPVYYDAYMLYYRKDVLKQYGFEAPPKTWEELKSVAKAITTKSGGAVMGYQHKGGDDHLNAINLTWQTFLDQADGHYMDVKTRKSTLSSPEGKQALEYIKSFYDEGISKTGPSAVNGFREGKVAMFEFAQNVIDFDKYITDENMKGKWAIAPVPKGPKSGASYAGGQGIAINAKTAHKEAAGKALKWLVQPAHMPIWMNNGHGIPAYDLDKVDADVKAKVQEVIDKDKENWEAILEQVKRNRPDLMVEQRMAYTARWDAQKKLLIAALGGFKPVDEVLKGLDAEVNQALQ